MSEEELHILVKELCALPHESEWVEFKQSNSNPEEIGEYLSVLANAACLENKEHGYLIYGIQDSSHRVVGTDFKPRTKKVRGQELENWLVTQLEPKVDFKFFEFMHQGFRVVLMQVEPANNRPVAFKNIAYIRVGTYKK